MDRGDDRVEDRLIGRLDGHTTSIASTLRNQLTRPEPISPSRAALATSNAGSSAARFSVASAMAFLSAGFSRL